MSRQKGSVLQCIGPGDCVKTSGGLCKNTCKKKRTYPCYVVTAKRRLFPRWTDLRGDVKAE